MSVIINGSSLKNLSFNQYSVNKWVVNDVLVWQKRSSVRMTNPDPHVVITYQHNVSYWMGTMSVQETEGTGFEILSDSSVRVLYPINVTIEIEANVGADGSSGWAAGNIAVNGVWKERVLMLAPNWVLNGKASYSYKANAGDIITAYCDGAGPHSYGAMHYLHINGVAA